MSDTTFHVAACVALEKTINSALRLDPGSRHAIARLQGQVLAMEVMPPGITFFFIPTADGASIQAHHEGSVDTRLKGSPLALADLMRSSRLNLADSGVEVFGGTGLLIELQRILNNLDIDWEQALSEVTGDVLGHQAAKGIRGIRDWAQGRSQTFKRLLGEYLTEELRAIPNTVELQYFCADVDELRLAADRLAAKVEQLRQQFFEQQIVEEQIVEQQNPQSH